MIQKNRHAFTLVELIVVITILAILATIAYISFLGYTKSARNSNRVYDIKVIEKAMSFFISTEPTYPLPDNPTTISYSGWLAWTQGTFSTWSMIQVGSIASIPRDPLTDLEYTYSVSNDKRNYQIWAMVEERTLFGDTIVPQSYALTSEWKSGYILGSYYDYDLNIVSGSDCSMVTFPSLVLSDIPSGWTLQNNFLYNFTYSNGPHIPSIYSWSVDPGAAANWFQIVEVLNSCNISSIAELELYIAQLSTAYQPLAPTWKYEDLVYKSNKTEFQLEMISKLQEKGITVDQSVIDELTSPTALRVFVDPFSNSDGVQLVSHIPSPLESWSILGGAASDYTISSNTLIKNSAGTTLAYPNPSPIITNPDYEVSFDVVDFSWWDISIYLRYTDSDNYYRLDISSAGYQVNRRLAGVDSVFQNILDPISNGTNIMFSVSGDSLVFTAWGIEKENIVAWGVDDTWLPLIDIKNSGASIDNYTLTYK